MRFAATAPIPFGAIRRRRRRGLDRTAEDRSIPPRPANQPSIPPSPFNESHRRTVARVCNLSSVSMLPMPLSNRPILSSPDSDFSFLSFFLLRILRSFIRLIITVARVCNLSSVSMFSMPLSNRRILSSPAIPIFLSFLSSFFESFVHPFD